MIHSLETERVVLEYFLTKSNSIDMLSMLKREFFYTEPHKLLFDAIKYNVDRDGACDLVSISAYLQDRELLDIVNASYLVELSMMSVPEQNIPKHIKTLQELSIKRTLLKETENLYNLINSDSKLVDIHFNINKMLENFNGVQQEGLEHISKYSDETIERLDSIYNNRYPGLKMPYMENLFPILMPSNFTLIGARPSVGKSAFAVDLTIKLAQRGHSIAFFSIEMGNCDVMERIISNMLSINVMETKFRIKNHVETIKKNIKRVEELGIYLNTSNPLTLTTLEASLIQLNKKLANEGKSKIELVVVDYLGLMTPESKFVNKNDEVSAISKGLFNLCKKFNIHVIALSQLNRGSEGRPKLKDLRDSGSLEQDANNVLFLYREDYEKHQDTSKNSMSEVEVIVAKQRSGPTGYCKMDFNREMQIFTEAVFD